MPKVTRRRSRRRVGPYRGSAPRKRTSSKQVKKNTREIQKLKSVAYQYAPFVLKQSGATSNAIHVSLLTAPSTWSGVYRMHGVSNDDLPRQYNMKSINFNWLAQCESADVGNLFVQVMIVSLKPKMAAQTSARTVRLSQMEENLDYVRDPAGTSFASMQGYFNYKLNPDLYRIHYHSGQRRIGESVMAGFGTEESNHVTNINNSTTMGRCTVPWKRVFKNDETADAGFKGLTFDQVEPRQHLYAVVFSNTSGGLVTGGELFLSMRTQFNGNCNNPD